LEEVLHQYLSICDIDEIKPVIIFTRRRALAREIEDNLRNKLDLEISLITGELEKRKREEILKAARSGKCRHTGTHSGRGGGNRYPIGRTSHNDGSLQIGA
jgi:superfamily II DNA/RNA helicase